MTNQSKLHVGYRMPILLFTFLDFSQIHVIRDILQQDLPVVTECTRVMAGAV